MEEKEKTIVSDTISEKAVWIKVGMLPIHAKPLTLLQVQEIGELMKDVKCDIENADEGTSVQAFIFNSPRDAELVGNAIVKGLFRNALSRHIFGGYVKRHMTSKSFKEAYSHIHAAFDYDFFLTSLIFLRGTRMRTKKTEADTTTQATQSGEWLEV